MLIDALWFCACTFVFCDAIVPLEISRTQPGHFSWGKWAASLHPAYYSVQILFLFLLSFYFMHHTYDTLLQHDNTRPPAACNTIQFLANNNIPNSPLAFHVPRLKPKQTRLERVGDEFEAEWTPLQTCVNCFRHLSRSGWPSKSKWFTTWSSLCLRDAGQLMILEVDTPPTDVHVSKLQNTQWLNLFLDERSVKIINFDLNQLQNEIWWNWILVEFSTIQF